MTNTETTYSDSAKGVTITIERAYREINAHGGDSSDHEDFLESCYAGELPSFDHDTLTVDAGDVLAWLGY
jgi:hypothetical protein